MAMEEFHIRLSQLVRQAKWPPLERIKILFQKWLREIAAQLSS